MTPSTEAVANMVKAALEAVKAAAINADPPTSAVYIGEPRDEDLDMLPRHYQVLHVTTGIPAGPQRMTGQTTGRKYRFVVRYGGSTYAEAAGEADWAVEALDEKVLTLAGFSCGRTETDSETPIAPDNDLPDWYDGVRVWTTIIKPLPA